MGARDDSAGLTHGRVTASAFRPHPLIRDAHLQTILPTFRRLPPLDFRRERIELPDGDFVDLGWCDAGAGRDAPLVLLLHGLTGGFESKYLRGTARRLLHLGLDCVILQMRGAGSEPNRLPRSYHHGASDDLAQVIDLLVQRFPGRALAAAGWSLGANVLLKYLGEAGSAAPFRAAAAACAPFQLLLCAERLRSGFSRVYQQRLLRDLKLIARRKFGSIDVGRGNLAAGLAARDFFEFDDALTAPLNGFADARDYYARASCGPFLRQVRVPTLVINALDDPFMTRELIPQASALAPDVTLELSEFGGHVGFIGIGRNGLPAFWLERRIPEFLARQLAP